MKRITFFILVLILQLSYSVLAQGMIGTDQSFAKTDFCKRYQCHLVSKVKFWEMSVNYTEYTYGFKNKSGIFVTNTWQEEETLSFSRIIVKSNFNSGSIFVSEFVKLLTGAEVSRVDLFKCSINAQMDEETKEIVLHQRSIRPIFLACNPDQPFDFSIRTWSAISSL